MLYLRNSGAFEMIAIVKADIHRLLYEYYYFQECIIKDIQWHRYGTSVDIVFDYVWSGNAIGSPSLGPPQAGRLREDLKTPKLIVVRFRIVQEFHLRNALHSAMIEQIQNINWGINEVSSVNIEDDNLFLSPYRGSQIPFHHITCRWEGDRRIDIVFGTLEILR